MTSNRTKRIINGFIATLGGGVTLQLLTILVTPLYLELTSQELFGVWLTLGSVLAWINLADAGINTALVRRSIEVLEGNCYDTLRRLIYGSLLFLLPIGFVFSLSGYLLTNLLVEFFNIGSSIEKDFIKTFHILLLIGLISPSLKVIGNILEAKQHIAFTQTIHTITTIISIAVNIILLSMGMGIVSFAYGMLFKVAITFIIELIYLKKIDKKIIFTPIGTAKKEVKSLVKFGGWFQILKIANLISTSADNIIIAAMLGASYVTVYVFTGKLAYLFAVFLLSIIPSILFPSVSQLFELKHNEKVRSLYIGLSKISMRLGIFLGLIYYIINEEFIKLWVGMDSYGGSELTLIFVVWIFLESNIRGVSAIIYSSEDIRGLALISIIELILNVVLSLYLVKIFGVFGVVLATVISRMLGFLYIPLKLNKMLGVNRSKFISGILDVLGKSTPMVLIVASIFYNMEEHNDVQIQLIALVLTATILNIIFFEGVFLLKQKDGDWKSRIKKVRDCYFL